ncbi:hypothetical protein DOTSEDRAFT_167089 [Dothistroma septosporum NZE10]|uniref:TOG domain-containing protein n=1 Tax=Dothistroma septosporum (strain NZE10 / CBS 128990) TaxID=675120 RepID=N1PW68_DOTSN|nr:hypothetical protein DOTSEDRAFT_167089 [Dothistroma septosporum NZE10]
MDGQAAALLAILKRPAASSEQKVQQFNSLKSDIKHYRVPESSQAAIFECIRLAVTQQASSTLASTAFSTLGHLIKRLKIQDASGHAITQLAPRLFEALRDRLGDLREPVRSAASQALSELYPFCGGDVEEIVRDEAIGGSNARAKEAGMRWVLRMHNEENMPFKGYTASIVARLEDADGNTREAAKTVLIDLFSDAPDRAKLDLKRQLKAHSVRHSIASQILSQLGAEETSSRPQTAGRDKAEASPDMNGSTRSLPAIDHAAHFAETLNSEAAQPPPQETVPMDPIYMDTSRELEDTFVDMRPHFEGKETEQNWIPRDKNILKLRRILKGNAPNEFHQVFMAGIKSMVEGIIKVASSLRTTMATNGCQLVQELAKTLGPALDPHVEMFLQTFIKMSAATKHIAAEAGRVTADSMFQNCSYHVRMLQHIWSAAQEKNVQQRQCSAEWLRTIMRRQAGYKHGFESSGGLELAEKCVKKGLDDANPKVKEGYRATYWILAKDWPQKAEAIICKLDPKSRTALERDLHNPNASLHQSTAAPATGRSTGTASRNALRELMAEQRKAKAGGKLPSRPNSAMADLSPAKQRPSASLGTGNSLMSGPVRRPRRPEITRPQTADPYASRRMLRPETPATATPAGSPDKGTGASKGSVGSTAASRSRAKTAEANAGSPAASSAKRSPVRSPVLHRAAPQHTSSSRPTSKGSTNADPMAGMQKEDIATITTKNGLTAGRGAFSPGHKRPGLGQTHSVDSGLPDMVEDADGFTMVMPSLTIVQPRARSPLAYRSPMKAMFEDARRIGKLSPEAEKHIHGKPSESTAIETQRHNGAVKTPQPEEVQIYEDPFTDSAAQVDATDERTVLGELPVNENVRLTSPAQSNASGGSPAASPLPVQGMRLPMSAQDRADLMRNKKLLISGIERVRTKTLDAHGFRRMQDIAKSRADIWDGGKKYDELMTVVLEYLQTFDQDNKLSQQLQKAAGLKAQALGLVRALLTLHRKNAAAWYAKALVTVFVCRVGIDASSHVLADMHRTADEIIREAVPENCIDAILDFLPPSGQGDVVARSVAMALIVLRQLVNKTKARSVDLGAERKARLAHASARYLNDTDLEVRKVDVDLASELVGLYGTGDEERNSFWIEFKGVDEGRLELLTYYIAKKGRAVGQ